MTASTTVARNDHDGDGSKTEFAYKFLLQDAQHLAVYLTTPGNAPARQIGGFSVSGINDPAGGEVTFTSPPGNGELVSLIRDVPADAQSTYNDTLLYADKSVEQALDQLFLAQAEILTMEQFGAVGDGAANDSAAWENMIAEAHTTGKTVLLSGKTYRIPDAVRKDLVTNPVTIIGIGNPVLDGGDGVELFRTLEKGLTFRNVTTKNICLINTSKFDANIDLIDVRDWTWDNRVSGTQNPQHSIRVKMVFKPASGSGLTSDLRLKKLVLRNIDGVGGLGGAAFECAIENVDIDSYSVQGIVVPDDDAHFEAGGKMKNAGYGDGLLLGDDDPDAQDECQSWSIGRVSVNDLHDQRVQRGSALIASCDGVRLQGKNISVGQVDSRLVRSAYEVDTTGAYFKAQDAVIGSIYIENAGGHEAGCVFKGARRTNGNNARGFSISVGTLKLFADDDDDRCAVYLAPDDVHIGFLSIEGYGGDVVDGDGNLRSGSGPLVFCESTDKSRLHIDRYSIVNCQLGQALDDSGSGQVEVFSLRGYREIKIGPGYVDNISNDKWSTRSPDMSIFRWSGGQSTTVTSIEIGSAHIRGMNAGTGSAQVTLFNLDSNKRLDHFTAWNPIIDNSVDHGLVTKSGSDIGRLQVIGGDLTACTPNELDLNGTTPATSFIGCNGL